MKQQTQSLLSSHMALHKNVIFVKHYMKIFPCSSTCINIFKIIYQTDKPPHWYDSSSSLLWDYQKIRNSLQDTLRIYDDSDEYMIYVHTYTFSIPLHCLYGGCEGWILSCTLRPPNSHHIHYIYETSRTIAYTIKSLKSLRLLARVERVYTAVAACDSCCGT